MGAPPALLAYAGVAAALGAERLAEILIHRRNAARLAKAGAVWAPHDGFVWILAAQAALFVLPAAEILLAPWPAIGWWTWAAIGILLLAQALRYWCITTLGWRWAIRIVTVPGAPRIVGGPYRWLRHPNYLAVAVESVALPLAFGAWVAGLAVFAAHLAALGLRIGREERALAAASPPAGSPGNA